MEASNVIVSFEATSTAWITVIGLTSYNYSALSYGVNIPNGPTPITPNCKNVYFAVVVKRDTNSYTKTLPYTIRAKATGLIDVTHTGTLYVESLVSQNRNSITSVSGPSTVYIGHIYTYVFKGKTSSNGYGEVSPQIFLPNVPFSIIDVNVTFASPTGTVLNSVWGDACSWSYNSLPGTCTTSGTYGDDVTLSVNVLIRESGSSTLSPLIYDKSGSSFHYNSDFTTLNVHVAIKNPAVDDFYSTPFTVPITFNPLVNDVDPSKGSGSNTLTLVSVSTPSSGTAKISGNSVTYICQPGFVGTISFDYTLIDSSSVQNSGKIAVTCVDIPKAVDDSYSTYVNQKVSFTPMTNDTEPNGLGFSVTSTTNPSKGSISRSDSGNQISYIPNNNIMGSDSFTYTITNTMGVSSTATITITIINRSPIAVADAYTINVNKQTQFNVINNDSEPDGQSYSITSVGTASHGVVTLFGNNVNYSPASNYAGADSFIYTLTDASGATAIATVSITIINNAPIAIADSYTTSVNAAKTINPMDNDKDPENQSISISFVGTPVSGTAVKSGNSIVYTPSNNFVGSDSFTYTIADASGATSTSTISFTVINHAPVAQNDIYSSPGNTQITISPMINDTDSDGQQISLLSVSTPSHGTAVKSGANIIYTPSLDYAGVDAFTYTISDASSATASASISITMTNNPPTAVNDAYSTIVNIPKSVNPLSNDSDPDNQVITLVIAGTPSHGTLSITGNIITYSPGSNYFGADSFTYTIADASGATSSSQIVFTIINNAPIALSDSVSTTVNTVVNISPLQNDNDPDGQSISVINVGSATHGTASISGGSTIIYTPATNFAGVDSISYTVADASGAIASSSVTITIINTPPVAFGDSYTTNMNTPLTFYPMSNDFDPDNQIITIINIATNPNNGNAVISGPSIVYTPSSNFFGADSLVYTIADASGATSSATVTITILNTKPDAINDAYATILDTLITIRPMDNDIDPQGRSTSITSFASGSKGNVAVVDAATLSYTNFGSTGVDTFTYTITNTLGLSDTATVTVNIDIVAIIANPNSYNTKVNVALSLLTLLENDVGSSLLILSTGSLSNSGAASISGDKLSITYTPALNYIGTETFTYTIGDSHGNTASALVSITITNSLPIAVDDRFSTTVNKLITLSPLTNDTDPDVNQAPSLKIVGTPSAGGSAVKSGNDIVYTPKTDYVGTDVFTYTIDDPNGATSTATITITITNRIPVAVDNTISINVNYAVSVPVVDNDYDPDGQIISVIEITQPTDGYCFIEYPPEAIFYFPSGDFKGTDSFTYTITDTSGGTSTAIVHITVINTPPVALSDSYSMAVNTVNSFIVLLNDSDSDYQYFYITEVGSPSHGTAVIDTELRSITYTPNANYAGTDSFIYTINDASGDSASTTVTVDVINQAPNPFDDSYTTRVNVPITFSPLLNDKDPDNQVIVVTNVGSPTHGAVSSTSATITFTPSSNYAGVDTFSYGITDQSGASATAKITILVINTPPDANDDTGSTYVNIPITIAPLANDNDIDNQAIIIIGVGATTKGTAITSGNQIIYTPSKDFAGSESFLYTIADASGDIDTAIISISVVNRFPIANNDIYQTNMNAAIKLSPTSNDEDPDNQIITITSISINPSQGTTNVTGNIIHYSPPAEFIGTAYFSYTISDPSGGISTAVITIQVIYPPIVASTDFYLNTVNNPIILSPLINDVDPFGHELIIVRIGTPSSNGIATIQTDSKSILYTPSKDYVGTESLSYTVSNSYDIITTSFITISISNTAPVAVSDSTSTGVNTLVVFSPLQNDYDPDKQSIKISKVGSTLFGTIIFDDSLIAFHPNLDVAMDISFDYEIVDPNGGTASSLITIRVINSLPIGFDDEFNTEVNTPALLNVLNNDLDPDGRPLIISSISATSKGGKITISTDKTVLIYTPSQDFVGTDDFTYVMADPSGGVDFAHVTVAINSKNPVANNDNYVSKLNSEVTIQPTENDNDPNNSPLTIISVSTSTHKAIIDIDSDGISITYAAPFNYIGLDSFSYTIQNIYGDTTTGQIVINVENIPIILNNDNYATFVNLPVTATPLNNDIYVISATVTLITQPTKGIASFDGNQIVFTPLQDDTGVYSIEYTIIDSLGSTGTASITFTVVNRNPVANPDTATTSRRKSITITPMLNDSDPDNQPIIISSLQHVTSGTATLSAYGSEIIYVPLSVGTELIQYTISDPSGGTATSFVTITINPEIVYARDDEYDINSNTPSTIYVLNNDGSSNDDNLLILSAASSVNGGQAIISEDKKTINFIPAINFFGEDYFTYTVVNSYGDTNSAAVYITIKHAYPQAIADNYLIEVNAPFSFSPIQNDINGDGLSMSISLLSTPVNGGIATIVNSQVISYSPFVNYVGIDSFSYTIVDNAGGISTSQVLITVINDNPIAKNDYDKTIPNGNVTIAPLGNDVEPNDQSMIITSITQPSHGVAIITSNSGILYTPEKDFEGKDSLTYTIADPSGGSATATIEVIVKTPIANEDNAQTLINQSVTIFAVSNDETIGDYITIVSVDTPSANGGSVIISGSNFIYTPPTDFVGADTFSYVITDTFGLQDFATITVNVINGTLVANDDILTTTVDKTLIIYPLENDVFANPVVISSATNPLIGIMTMDTNQIVYTPPSSFVGSDSFSYTITDIYGEYVTASISILVTNNRPIAIDDQYNTVQGESITLDPLSNDYDPNGQVISLVSILSTSAGDLTIVGNLINFAPNIHFIGAASFVYSITDPSGATDAAQITISVSANVPKAPSLSESTPVNSHVVITPPIESGSQITNLLFTPNGGEAILANNVITYRPDTDFMGTFTLVYTVTNIFDTSSDGIITIEVVNTPPVSTDDISSIEACVSSCYPLVINPLDNDFDPNNQLIRIISVNSPDHGTVVFNDTSIIYTPEPLYAGHVDILYTISDPNSGTSTSTVYISLGNSSPIAMNDSYSVLVNSVDNLFTPLLNDSDPNGNSISIISTGKNGHGNLVINNNNNEELFFTPENNFAGEIIIEYTISDSYGAFASAFISITVVNSNPIATDDSYSTLQNILVTLQPLENDFDPDNQHLTITEVTNGSSNAIISIIDGGNMISYVPPHDFIGIDQFTYTVSDPNGGTAVGTIIINILVTGGPNAQNDLFAIFYNTQSTLKPLNNDLFLIGFPISILSIENSSSGGSAIILPDKLSILYTPYHNYVGIESFTYTVIDSNGKSSSALIQIYINNPNPIAIPDAQSTHQDSPITLSPLLNDVDPNGLSLSITEVISSGEGGNILIEDGIRIIYTPPLHYVGEITLTYTITNSLGGSSTSTILLKFLASLLAKDDYIRIHSGGSIRINPLDNDFLPNGPADVISITNPLVGTSKLLNSGIVLYTADETFTGVDSFQYTIRDSTGSYSTASIVVFIANPVPSASSRPTPSLSVIPSIIHNYHLSSFHSSVDHITSKIVQLHSPSLSLLPSFYLLIFILIIFW